MEFTIKLNDELFEEPVRNAVSIAVNRVVTQRVGEFIKSYEQEVDKAVALYLSKRLTDESIKDKIDEAVKTIIADKLRDGSW